MNEGEISLEKQKWLQEMGAKRFPEPVTHIYSFKGYSGAFNLSDEYIKKSSLDELKAQYEKNKLYVTSIILSD